MVEKGRKYKRKEHYIRHGQSSKGDISRSRHNTNEKILYLAIERKTTTICKGKNLLSGEAWSEFGGRYFSGLVHDKAYTNLVS